NSRAFGSLGSVISSGAGAASFIVARARCSALLRAATVVPSIAATSAAWNAKVSQRRRFNHEADIKPWIVDAGCWPSLGPPMPGDASRLVTQRSGGHDCLDASCVHVIDQPADDQRGGHEWVLAKECDVAA